MIWKSEFTSRVVTAEKAIEFANKRGFEYFEVSAKTYINVDDMFVEMSRIILNKLDLHQIPFDEEPGIKVGELEGVNKSAKKGRTLATEMQERGCCGS